LCCFVVSSQHHNQDISTLDVVHAPARAERHGIRELC
jgi:hypothetical protein